MGIRGWTGLLYCGAMTRRHPDTAVLQYPDVVVLSLPTVVGYWFRVVVEWVLVSACGSLVQRLWHVPGGQPGRVRSGKPEDRTAGCRPALVLRVSAEEMTDAAPGYGEVGGFAGVGAQLLGDGGVEDVGQGFPGHGIGLFDVLLADAPLYCRFVAGLPLVGAVGPLVIEAIDCVAGVFQGNGPLAAGVTGQGLAVAVQRSSEGGTGAGRGAVGGIAAEAGSGDDDAGASVVDVGAWKMKSVCSGSAGLGTSVEQFSRSSGNCAASRVPLLSRM